MRVIAGSARGAPLAGPPGPETRPTSDKVRGAIFDVLGPVTAGARVLDLYAGTGAMGVEALSRGAVGCLFVEWGAATARVVEANLRATKAAERGAVWRLDVARALDHLEARYAAPPAEPTTTDEQSRVDAPAGAAAWQGWDDVRRSALVRAHAQGRSGEKRPVRGGTRGAIPTNLPPACAPPYTIVILDPPYDDAAIVAVVERLGSGRLLAAGAFVVLEHSKRIIPPEEIGVLRPRRARRYGDTAVTIWEYPREG